MIHLNIFPFWCWYFLLPTIFGLADLFVHSITTFSTYEDGSVSEVTRPISSAQHHKIKVDRADSTRPTVRQRRVTFLWECQMFELHTDVEPSYSVSVLHRRSEVSWINRWICLWVDQSISHQPILTAISVSARRRYRIGCRGVSACEVVLHEQNSLYSYYDGDNAAWGCGSTWMSMLLI